MVQWHKSNSNWRRPVDGPSWYVEICFFTAFQYNLVILLVTVTVNRLEIQHVKRDALNNTYVCQASNTKLVPPAERTVRVEMLCKCQREIIECSRKAHKFSSPSTGIHIKYHTHIITEHNLFPIHNRDLFLLHIWKLCKLFLTLCFLAHSFLNDSTVRPISTSIVHKPKQLATESQITLSCEVEGSVPDTDIKWTQNNRVFERGNVS